MLHVVSALLSKVIKRSFSRHDAPDHAPILDHGVRAATLSDMPAILSMVAKSCALHQKWDSAKFGVVDDFATKYGSWLSTLTGDPHGVFLVAVADRRVVGYLVGTVDEAVPIYQVRQFGYIRDVWVEEGHRTAGMGRKLVDAALKRFGALRIQQVRLETAAANVSARSFFAACGFRPCATEMLIEQPIARPKC